MAKKKAKPFKLPRRAQRRLDRSWKQPFFNEEAVYTNPSLAHPLIMKDEVRILPELAAHRLCQDIVLVEIIDRLRE